MSYADSVLKKNIAHDRGFGGLSPPETTCLKLIHTATPDMTKLSCLCRVRFGDVNRIPDNSRLSPTEILKSEYVNGNCAVHTATPDTTRTGLFCVVSGVCGGVNWALPTTRAHGPCTSCIGATTAEQLEGTSRRVHVDPLPVSPPLIPPSSRY